MAREIYCNDVKFSQYSLWHRSQHNGIAMVDIDKIATCCACSEPLFLAETVRYVNQGFKKGHSVTKNLAIKAGLPAFIIWYRMVGNMFMGVKVKRIAPDYKNGYSSEPIDYTADQWLQYLEYKQLQHYPNCKKKSIFLEKIKDPRIKHRRAYAPILYK